MKGKSLLLSAVLIVGILATIVIATSNQDLYYGRDGDIYLLPAGDSEEFVVEGEYPSPCPPIVKINGKLYGKSRKIFESVGASETGFYNVHTLMLKDGLLAEA